MKIEPSGVVLFGECELQLSHCLARSPAPVTAVWTSPSRRQINVCRPCLEDMVRAGEWEIQGAKIRRVYDLAIYDQSESLQLVVEAKIRPYEASLDPEQWAIRIHRNLLAHSAIPVSCFFLLANYPSPFFLWVAGPSSINVPPDYSFDAQDELQPYLDKAGLDERSETHLTSAIREWLTSIVEANHVPVAPGREWLFQSGLYSAIKGGRVTEQSQSETHEMLSAA